MGIPSTRAELVKDDERRRDAIDVKTESSSRAGSRVALPDRRTVGDGDLEVAELVEV